MNFKTLFAIAMATVSLAAQAQEARIVDQLVSGTCGAFSSQLSSQKEIRFLMADRPIENSVVCSCANDKVKQDERLLPLNAMDNAAFVRAADTESNKAYIIGRVLHSIITCFGVELDSALAASKALR